MLSDNLTSAGGIIEQGEKIGLLVSTVRLAQRRKKYSMDEAPASDRRETSRQRPGNNLSCDLAICVVWADPEPCRRFQYTDKMGVGLVGTFNAIHPHVLAPTTVLRTLRRKNRLLKWLSLL
jgi:hypothetical protein